MSINSISHNLNMNSIGAYSQKLTQQTKKRLNELGISYSDNMTESQGKTLIKEAEIKQSSNDNNKNQQNFSQNHDKKDDTMQQAIALAQKVGIKADKNSDFEELTKEIEATLEEKMQANKNNVNLLQELKGYSEELSNIQAQSNENQQATSPKNEALMMSLELLSNYNRQFLN